MAELIELAVGALLALCVVRFVLTVAVPGAAKLPHPSQVPGLPIAGPASATAAHVAIMRCRAARPWWKFWS